MKSNKILIVILLSFCSFLFAQTDDDPTDRWRLVWDKNDTSDHVIDYTIYRDGHSGASTVFATVVHDSEGVAKTMEFVDSVLTAGVHYHYRIKARNNVGLSGYSSEVNSAIPRIDLSSIYRLGAVSSRVFNLNENVTYITESENTLQWEITPASNDTLTWSIINNVATIVFPNDWWGTQTLFFKATTPDTFTNVASVSFVRDSTSSGDDQRVYDVQIDTSTVSEAYITWKTDLSSRDRIRYGETTAYGDSSGLSDVGLIHGQRLESLNSDTEFNFVIVSDFGGSANYISQNYTFTTKSGPVITPPGDGSVNVYPIPLRLSDPGARKQITFDDLPANSEILIFTMLGDPVFKVKDLNDGRYVWDLLSDAGQTVHSGLYLYVVKSPGKKKEGKIIIIF